MCVHIVIIVSHAVYVYLVFYLHVTPIRAVQCPVAILTPQPFVGYVVGGSAVSLRISDPCFLASDDTPKCAFDGFEVGAERSDAINTAACVIPSVRDPGPVAFEFSYFSRTLGSVTFTSTLEACKFVYSARMVVAINYYKCLVLCTSFCVLTTGSEYIAIPPQDAR